MSKPVAPAQQDPFALTSPMAANAQKFLFSMARLQAQGYKAMMRYQIEALSFLKHRYEEDVKLAEELAASTDFTDAFDVYAGFVQNAVTEYSSESGKMANIGSRIASETARRVRRETDAAIEDMAAQTVA
ncbi:MAG: phasin family protein [Rhizobiaceae bacterium]|nr:MAG: phasin family protein [Rhizobiaceae bacterium]CAG0948192.1 hypothetical protein RHIZO_00008 [Rhizobiaceae bacterium]